MLCVIRRSSRFEAEVTLLARPGSEGRWAWNEGAEAATSADLRTAWALDLCSWGAARRITHDRRAVTHRPAVVSLVFMRVVREGFEPPKAYAS